jgi:hypothetical protein
MVDMEHPEEEEGDMVLQVAAMVVTLPQEHQVDSAQYITNRVLHLVRTLSKSIHHLNSLL